MPEQDPRTQATQTPEQIPNIDLRQADQNGLLRGPVLQPILADSKPGGPLIDTEPVGCEPYGGRRLSRAAMIEGGRGFRRNSKVQRLALGIGGGIVLAVAGSNGIERPSEREALAQEPSMQPNTDPEHVKDYCIKYASDEPIVSMHKGARKIKTPGAVLRPWVSALPPEGPLINSEIGRIPCDGTWTFKIWRYMENDEGKIKRVSPITPLAEIVSLDDDNLERIRGYYDVPVNEGVRYTCLPGKAVRRSGFETRKILDISGERKVINTTHPDRDITPAFGRGTVKFC